MSEHGPADAAESAGKAKAEDLRTAAPDTDVRHPLWTSEGLAAGVAIGVVMWLVLIWVIWECL